MFFKNNVHGFVYTLILDTALKKVLIKSCISWHKTGKLGRIVETKHRTRCFIWSCIKCNHLLWTSLVKWQKNIIKHIYGCPFNDAWWSAEYPLLSWTLAPGPLLKLKIKRFIKKTLFRIIIRMIWIIDWYCYYWFHWPYACNAKKTIKQF